MYLYATGVYSSGEELHYKFTLAFKERNCPKKPHSLGSLGFSSACTIASSFSCCAKSTRRVECPTSLHSLKKPNEQTKRMRASLTLTCVLFFASLINNSGNT